MRASSTLPPGSQSSSLNAGRRLRGRALLGGVVAVAVAALLGSVLVQPAATSTRAPTPRGPGSVSGAPNLPPGFTKTFTSRYVDANGLRMHAVIGGEGPPLLLIHGWPQTWYAWRLVMPALARDFRVIAVDQRGIGLTDKPAGGYDTGSQADDMVALMEALGHRRFAVYGTDTGMPIAYALAADHRDRVQRLVVAEASLPGVAPSPPLFLPPLLNERLWHIPFNRTAEVNERLVKGREDIFFGNEFAVWAARPLPDDAVRYYIRILRSDRHALRGSFGWYRALDATIEQEAQRATRRLTLPVLAIGGQFGAGETVAATMQAVADDVQGVVIPGSGHWVAEEAPEELLAALTKFLASYRDASAAARP
jgi:pimeloyl-ACP methyl ester carboxylesterase